MPTPYMVDRFNVLANRNNIDFSAWFSTRWQPVWSGPWTVDESSWSFDYRYVPTIEVKGRGLGFPPQLIKRRAPDVLISPHGEPSFVAGWNVARLRGIRTAFWVVKTFESWVARQSYKEALKRYMFPRTDAIFVPGDDAREFARRYGALDERIYTAQHPVDAGFVHATERLGLDARREVRRELGLEGTTFIYVGRLWWGKGLDHLLTAFGEVQRSQPPVSLLLVGEGDEQANLDRMVRDLDLRNVFFAGFQQKEDLPRYYASADVLVFPSLGDPYGLVIDEAMTCELPVIATSATGEIGTRIADGISGFIVPPGDSGALASRMSQLVADPLLAMQMGRLGKAEVHGQTPDRWAAEIELGIHRTLELPPAAASSSA